MKDMKNQSHRYTIGLAAAGIMAIGMVGLNAQTTWNGNAGDNDWHNALNWSNGLPDVGKIPVIQTAGAVVNLTQDVTVSGGTFNLRAFNGTGAPATLNISANLNLGSNNFEIGSRYSGDSTSRYYQGVVNHTAGEVTAGHLRVPLRGSESPPSEYNMSGGKLMVERLTLGAGSASASAAGTFRQTGGEVNVASDLRLSDYRGTGIYLMEGGTLTVNGGTFHIAERSLTNPTFHQTGGEVTMSGMGIGRIARRNDTQSSSIGTMIVESGKFTWQSETYFTVAERVSTDRGTFIKYGAADVSFSTESDTEPALMISRTNGNGTLRAVIDQTGFDPIRVQSSDHAFNAAGNSHFQVALDGGVMLSGTNAFQIVESVEVDDVRGSVTGDWGNVPGALWTTYTGEVVGSRDVWGVQIELDEDFNRGTLNASTIGNQLILSASSSVGYIGLNTVDLGNPLQLRLGIDPASIGASNLGDFIGDLAAAGYSPLAFGDHAVDIMLDPLLNGADYFAWDLSSYTSSGPLQIESITVIPEPSTLALLGLMGASLLRRRRPRG